MSRFQNEDDEKFFDVQGMTNKVTGEGKKQLEYRRTTGRTLEEPIVRTIRVEKLTVDAIILHWADVWKTSYSETVSKIVSAFHNSNTT